MNKTNYKTLKALPLLLTFNFLIFTCLVTFSQSGAAINTTGAAADASAAFEISSTTGGTLITRMTTAERNLIGSPAEGLQIFNTTTKCFEFFANNTWNQSSCAFVCGNVVFDNRDANIYQTVQIGTQCWMKANLKYLPTVHNNSEFAAKSSNSLPGYGVYGYDGSDVSTAKAQGNYATYGVLYNWHAAMAGSSSSSANPSGVKGVCPSGWHLPSDLEWQQLEIHLGMNPSVANTIGWRGTDQGSQLKESGTTHWTSPNTGATNSSDFTALPGGFRYTDGLFYDLSGYVYWWSATEDGSFAWTRPLRYSRSTVYRDAYDKGRGFAVRCLRD